MLFNVNNFIGLGVNLGFVDFYSTVVLLRDVEGFNCINNEKFP